MQQTIEIVQNYLTGFSFIIKDAGRDPDYLDNHLLSYLAQDVLQSVVSLMTLSSEGMLSVAKRELRFLLEASIKICFVQQRRYSSTVETKLAEFDKELSSQRISIKNNLDLALLPENMRTAFADEVGRLYGQASAYVHLTPAQISASIEAAEAGVVPGNERPSDMEALNQVIARVLAASLVLLFHSVPHYVAGDWLVEADGRSVDWYFMRSRYVAAIDSSFDYKHERQPILDEVRTSRAEGISF